MLLVVAAAHWALYAVVLRAALGAAEVEVRRAGLVRWTGLVLGLEALVIAGAGVYVLALLDRHAAGWAWVAPAVWAVVGAAVPLQVVVGRIVRSAVR